ncbi:MAG: hypothetical protein ACI31V_04545 [Bacilli bacterium]
MGNQKSGNGIIALLVLIVIILSVLVVLTGTGVVSFKNNSNDDVQISDDSNVSSNENDVKQKSSVSKSQILSYYKEKISDLSTSDNLYSVVDINDDDIPELFIYVTGVVGNQIIADTSIYTYDENKCNEDNNYIVFVGSVSGRIDNNTILYKMNDGKLLSVFGHMGYESVAYYELKNDWLVRTEFSSKETNDYMTGDTEIQFVSCDDTSLIDNYR